MSHKKRFLPQPKTRSLQKGPLSNILLHFSFRWIKTVLHLELWDQWRFSTLLNTHKYGNMLVWTVNLKLILLISITWGLWIINPTKRIPEEYCNTQPPFRFIVNSAGKMTLCWMSLYTHRQTRISWKSVHCYKQEEQWSLRDLPSPQIQARLSVFLIL